MKSFEQFFLEEKLDAEDRNEMDDSDFGIPETRSFPLKGKNEEDTKTHITQAMRMFPHADARYKDALAKRILRAAKAHGIDTSNWKIDKKYNKPIKESVGPEDDDTSGTSEFDEIELHEPDDCYTESDIFITEADKRFLNELQKKNDQIPMYELNKYGKKLIHYFNHGRSRTLVVNIKVSPNNHIERRCDEYYSSLIKAIDKFANDIEYGQLQPIKWYKYDKLVKTLFHSIGINYNKDRVLGEHTPGRLYFEEREYKKYKYDPNTDVLVHISKQKNLTSLKPTHCSRDGVTYPRPRIYSFLEKRSNLSSLRGNEYGDNIYVIDINKSFDVYHDMEYGKRYEEEKDKYGKPIFINTVKPLRVIPVEQILNNKQIAESFIVESNNDSIYMRPATKADLDRMYRWEMESIDKELQKDPKVQKLIREDVEQSIKDTQMIMDGRITIGMFTACMIDDGEWRYIGEIYLLPSYRGKGIGSGILRKEIEQYPKIRLQVATSNDKAIKLYKSLGFKIVKENKKQKMYLMEYTRDTVQEGVIQNIKNKTSPLEVCKDMVADLESYKYGIPENGRIVNGSEHDYDTKWKLQSPEEFEKNGGGICYDYVEFEEGYLDAFGIKCKKYFISTDLPGHDTHTFILVEDGKGGFIYPESSFKPMVGAHEVKNLDHACAKVADGFWKINDNLKKVKPESNPNIKKPLKTFKCYLWEYTGHPPYGSNMVTCTKYYSKGEPLREWTQVEPNFGEPIPGEPKSNKAKALQEFVTHFRGGI